jgi:crotonobetainyl-CoA:carnitine CoA-transferase CaiB-like acyl-CoA transferase
LGSETFSSFEGRKASEEEIERVLNEYALTWDREQLAMALQENGVPAYVVQSIPDLLADEQLIARGYWRHLDHKEIGPYVTGSLPFRWEGGAFAPTRPAPLLGEHTWELASRILGMSREEFDTLVAEGVLT